MFLSPYWSPPLSLTIKYLIFYSKIIQIFCRCLSPFPSCSPSPCSSSSSPRSSPPPPSPCPSLARLASPPSPIIFISQPVPAVHHDPGHLLCGGDYRGAKCQLPHPGHAQDGSLGPQGLHRLPPQVKQHPLVASKFCQENEDCIFSDSYSFKDQSLMRKDPLIKK